MGKQIAVVVVAVLCTVAVVAIGWHKAQLSADREREAAFTRLARALSVYANSSRYMLFPPKCQERNVFLPDMDALAKGLGQECSDIRQDSQVRALLENKGPRPLCYLGHVPVYGELVEILLDKYEKESPDTIRDANVSTDLDAVRNMVPRLRQGVDRFFAWQIGDASGPSRVPILWEMPRNGKDRFLVGFLNGDVKIIDYPVMSLPYHQDPRKVLSIRSLNRIRRAMGMPTDSEPSPFPVDSPVANAAREALQVGEYWRKEGGLPTPVGCDRAPTVVAKNCRGYRISLGSDYTLILFPESQEASALLSNDLTSDSSFGNSHLPGNILDLYLGTGMGFCWYGVVPPSVTTPLQRRLGLAGGDRIYPFLLCRTFPRKPPVEATEHAIKLSDSAKRMAALKETLGRPPDIGEYTNAFLLLRYMESCPPSQRLLDACDVLGSCPKDGKGRRTEGKNYLRACRTLCDEPDEQLVAVAVIAVAACWRDEDSLPFLMRFPKGPVIAALDHLGETLASERDREYAHRLRSSLDGAPPSEPNRRGS